MDRKSLQSHIINVLNNQGPKLGKELVAELPPGVSYLELWQSCFQSQIFQISHFSRYYLRYDIAREDLIRLSPSILRDFLSFTLIALPHQRSEVIDRRIFLSNEHRDISVGKINLARRILIGLDPLIEPEWKDSICAFVAGDIAYFLGHSEPRECEAIGEMVNGSDIDIILLHADDVPAEQIEKLDEHLSKQKYFYLKSPRHRQELDFICKPWSRMVEQFAYGDIHQKIACKILYESQFMYGSPALYMKAVDRMAAEGVTALIEKDLAQGVDDRKEAIQKLLDTNPDVAGDNEQSLFFFSQERVEFT